MASGPALAATDLPLIATKLKPPRQTGAVVHRDGLLARLDATANRSLVLVAAPAGYGKTSLLAQWRDRLAARGAITGWISLEEGDDDPRRFFAYMARVLNSDRSHSGEQVMDPLGAGPALSTQLIVALLVSELERRGGEHYLFLDDFHFVYEGAVLAVLRRLLENCPPCLHLVVASGGTPDLALSRMRAHGHLAEFSTADLRFSKAEIVEYFARAECSGLKAADIALLETRTEGWPAALQLASISLRHRADIRAFLDSFSGNDRDVTDFLSDDVLGRLDAPTRDFLLKTSILSRMSAPLCNALTGRDDGAETLLRLERLNLFLFSLDHRREWYRFHHLFAGFLRGRLATIDPTATAKQHRRAASWFRAQGLLTEAIEHTLAAGDYGSAAELLDSACDDILYGGQVAELMGLIGRLPVALIRRYPRLRLDQAWALGINRHVEEARHVLDDIVTTLTNGTAIVTRMDRSTIESKILHRRIMMSLFIDDIPMAARLARDWLAASPDTDAYSLGSAKAALLYAQRELYDCRDAERIGFEARNFFQRAGGRFGELCLECILAPTQALTGNLAAAEASCERAVAVAATIGGEGSTAFALAEVLRAELLYERDARDFAGELLDRYLPLVNDFGFVDQLVAGYTTLARIHNTSGAVDEALRTVNRGLEIARSRGLRRLHANLLSERLRLLCSGGNGSAVQRLAVEEDLLGAGQPFAPSPGATTSEEARAVAWARIAMQRGAAAEAADLLTRWVRFVDQRGCYRATARLAVLQARAHQQAGEELPAHRAFRLSLTRGRAAGLVRTFLDEGAALRPLLTAAARLELTGEALADYAAKLLASLDSECGVGGRLAAQTDGGDDTAAYGVIEILKDREIEILRLMGKGLPNRNIAADLGLSENTVKWHIKQAYGKLAVGCRADAIIRARRHGLIP